MSSIAHVKGASTRVRFTQAEVELPVDGVHLQSDPGLLVEAVVTNTGSCFLVEGDIRAALELTCGRCLQRYRSELVSPLRELYCRGEEEALSDLGDDAADGEPEWHAFTGHTFDIGPAVLEQLVVSLPMKLLCDDNCAGMCSNCGTDLNQGQCECEEMNVDPRLVALQDWFNQNGRE